MKQRETNMKKLAQMVYRRLHHRHEGKEQYPRLKALLIEANEILDQMQAQDLPDRIERTRKTTLGRGKRTRTAKVDNPAKSRLKAGQKSRTAKATG